MAEYDNIGPAGLIFFGGKRAAQHRLNSQGRKETRRRCTRIDLLRFVTASQSESVEGVDRHPVEDMVLPLPIQVVRRRDGEGCHSGETLRWRNMPDPNQPAGISEREWTQKRSIHHAENCSIGADP